MKKTIWIGLCAWLLTMGEVSADNTLSVASVSIPQGGQVTLEIVCNFENAFVGGQLDIELPDDGKITPTMSDGKPVITLGFTGTDHSLSNSQLKDAELNPVNSYRTLCASLSNSALPTSGVLLRMTLNANANAIEGTAYNAKLTGIEFGTKTDKYNLVDVPFTITIDNSIILDENSTTVPSAATNVDVRVKRTINANEWSTICLPFSMTAAQVQTAFGEGVKLADFTGYDVTEEGSKVVGITVNFNDVTAIEANHPYIIKVGNKVTEFTVDGVDVAPVDLPYVSFGYSSGRPQVYHPKDFIGTYVAGFDIYHDAQRRALFLYNNKFYYATLETKPMQAFRAYFDFDDVLTEVENGAGASTRINMSFNHDGGVATGISERNCMEKSEDIFDLQGRKIEKPLRKGLYIRDGKIIVK